ncbi:MAG: toll/interleukin-1 receptor domain-containing protein, partial [Sphingomonadaceae bacterium]
MSDIFISYARSTEEVAKAVGQQLVAAGHKVWRDDELPAHRSYSDVIEERLEQAKAVVVLWSAEAARSQWVRAEADIARNRGTLVQMSVDGTTPPIPFNQIQCADLNGWSGNDDHAGWKKVLD